ncbi:UDP-glucosyltransferase 2-like [Pieris napi]|uniref:UDP-glucosyltransferase 2-like n=1 Tax=Pieris napi TaxID=78633 RepID=UPI001FBBC130|nr:UDP-glucosyltransferase 2-like [Pieris napi]
MNCIVILIFIIITLQPSCNSLNIIGIFPYQGKSHFFVHRVYLQELVKRGHNVTVISHFPESDPPSNYHDVSLAGSIKILEDAIPLKRSYKTISDIVIFLTGAGRENCQVMLANKNVQNLLRDKPKFDIAVVEQFNSDCGLGVAYILGAPVIGITSHILMPWTYSRFGIPNHPAYVSFHFLEGGTKPTLYQRVERVLFDFYFKMLYYISQQRDQDTLAKHFDNIPPLEQLARDIKILLLYHNFVLTGSRLFPANVIEVGGYHVVKAKPLTGDLLKFVEEAEHGVIYISFGSVVKSSTMPDEKLQAVLGAISELPQRFIWKWESKTTLLDKNKLFLAEWLPQVDILGHPKTLAFLSHAGMGGTTEAIHFGVPVVAMPVLGDQPSNAAAIEESGLGVQLQIEDLTKDNLIAAFKKVLDPKFKANVDEVSNAWHDRPMPPLESAVYWTEFVARHPNITYKTAAVDTPLYQYLCLDVISVFSIAILLIYATYRWLIWGICRRTTLTLKEKHINNAKKKSKRA